MEENIEVKDVQKTEYLDKTGLDMLWTKVKENTHNQVEVEYNRAKAKEDSLSQEIASVKPAEGKVFLQVEDAEDGEGTKILKDDSLSFGDYRSQQAFSAVTSAGFSVKKDAQEVAVLPTGIKADVERESDTKVWNTNGGITDLTSYALNSDVTEKIAAKADTTALTALEEKITANTTAIEGKQDAGNYIPYNKTYETYYTIDGGLVISGEDCNSFYNKGSINFTYHNDSQLFNLSSNQIYGRVGNNSYTINAEDGIELRNETYRIAISGTNGLRMYATNDDGRIAKTTQISESAIEFTDAQNGDYIFRINETGIHYNGRKENEIPTANGGFVNINDYAKKIDLPVVATKEKLGVVKVGDGLNVTDGTVSVDPEYITEHFIDMMSYGVEWDTTVADPACTRIGNPLLHKSLPIQSEYKGCLVKNGKVNYYLDPNDWSKKADGTPSVLDGTDGDVMVHIPKFYGKSGSKGTKRWVRISTTKIDPSWVEIPEMFVSAYKVTLHKDTDSNKAKVASVVNTTANYRGGVDRKEYDKYLSTDQFRTDLGKPITNISRAQMRTNASNFGQELLCYEFYKWVFYWAYVIEYANFNSQKEFNSELTSDGYHQGGLGQGITTINNNHWNNYNNYCPLTPCGYTNEFGNFSGVKQMVIQAVLTDDDILVGSDTTTYANRWRGFENPFGDIWTNLDGIVLKRDSANAESKVYTTTDSSKFGDDISLMNVAGIEVASDGYTKEFDLGETGEIIPQLVGGYESTYKCDYHWCSASLTNTRMLLVGGRANNSGSAGLGTFSSHDTVGDTSSSIGFRSVIRA